jgi:protein ImuB
MPRPLFACLHVSQAVPRRGVLAEVAQEFSARVEAQGDRLVLLDVSGLERLFGEAQAIGLEIGRAAVRRGLAPRIAVGTTRVAVWLVVHARPGLTVIPAGGEAAALAPLPMAVLQALDSCETCGGGGARRQRRRGTHSRHYRLAPGPDAASERSAGWRPAGTLPSPPGAFGRRSLAWGLRLTDLPALLDTLSRWGVKTLGDLAALPPAALAARLGPAGPVLGRIARGDDPQPLVPDVEPERFEASFDLEWPVEGLEPLSFVLARVLEPLCERLVRADRGAAALSLRLQLVSRDVHERRLALPSPLRDPRVLRTLLLLDLESHPPTAGVDRVTVEAEPSPGPVVQYSLIDHPLPSPDDLTTLMARLGALMGDGRCGTPVVVDSHEPGAFAVKPFGLQASGPGLQASGSGFQALVPGVLRRFRVPIVATVVADKGRPLRVTTARRSLAGGRVEYAAGPWRTSGHWWMPSAWDRDEWDVSLADGTVYRLSRDRAQERWVVEGIVD